MTSDCFSINREWRKAIRTESFRRAFPNLIYFANRLPVMARLGVWKRSSWKTWETEIMRTPIEWINTVGEAAGHDMFCGNQNQPGSRTEEVINQIQHEAFNFGKEQGDMEGFKRGFNEGWKQGMTDAVEITKAHPTSTTTDRMKKRGVKMSDLMPEAQVEIQAEERGEEIASEIIRSAILSARDKLI